MSVDSRLCGLQHAASPAGREPTKAEIAKKTKALARKASEAAVPTCYTLGCSKTQVADGKHCRAHTCPGCGFPKDSTADECEDCVLASMRAEESEDAASTSDSEDSAYVNRQ